MNLLPTFAQRGDIAPLLNKIHHCDALALLRRLPDASIDLIVTSPPYDNLRTYKGFTWDFESIARESFRVLKPCGVLVWVVDDAFVNGSETLTTFRQAIYFVDTCGFRMHQRLIWEKQGMPRKRPKAYLPDFEDMLVMSKGEPKTFNPVMRKNNNAGTSGKKGSSGKNGFQYSEGYRVTPEYSIDKDIWTVRVGGKGEDEIIKHPAVFPDELAYRHIFTWSNPGDVVLDYFSGSGTTAKMAFSLERQYIACDIAKEYVTLACNRIAKAGGESFITIDGTKQLSLFETSA